jgi:S1-C subfamily serine protease
MLRLGATLLAVSLSGVLGWGMAGRAEAQGVAELFGKVAPAVVVVQAKDAGGGRVGDIGSGVVVSKDGKIMTAAHLVHGADRSRCSSSGTAPSAPGSRPPSCRRTCPSSSNMAGEVIGIVSHVISKSGGSEGLGFVVTMNTAKQLLLERRSIWSGLEGQLLSDDLADLFNLPPKTGGLLVKSVAQGSPGEAMGIKGGRKTATSMVNPWWSAGTSSSMSRALRSRPRPTWPGFASGRAASPAGRP